MSSLDHPGCTWANPTLATLKIVTNWILNWRFWIGKRRKNFHPRNNPKPEIGNIENLKSEANSIVIATRFISALLLATKTSILKIRVCRITTASPSQVHRFLM
jgi:hypothetical protein